MARLRTIKFSISMTASEFRELESARRKTGKTRSQFIREAALREPARPARNAPPGSVREERRAYGGPEIPVMTDAAELKRRAIAAAGAFESGLRDLSTGHDRYLSDPEPGRGAGAPGGEGEQGGGT
jgi:hypothetical protein